ncbi:hypothetical protein TNCV_2958391 [Trichonephila clavipes]|nr:hypothetical protein TNCV_2958391 [Trichonephila clavipes]
MGSISPKNDFSTGKRIQKGYQIWRIYRFGENTLGAISARFDKSTENLVENTVEVEDKSHEEEEDNGESEELVENLDKALDLEFESGVGTDALFHVTYAEKNSIT